MPKHIYKKTEKGMDKVGILPSIEEWNRKSDVGHTHAIKTLNTSTSSSFPVSSSEEISGSGSINLHKVSKTGNFRDLNNRGEAFLSWGGQNLSGSYGPIDAAMVPELGANRLAFMPADAITIEYSRDGGSTWTDYGPTDSQKADLFNGRGYSFTIGKATGGAGNIATNKYQLRVNIYTSAGHVYTVLNKFVIYLSTSGTNNNWCTIKARKQSDYTAGNDKWTIFANKISVSGWSGYNVINTAGITTYGNTDSSQYGHIQFIFGCDTGSTNNSYAGLNISKIFGFGGVGWTTPSTMAKTGHIYTYDSSQNVTFPAAITSGIVNSYNILPRGNNTYNLGSDSSKWAHIYATTIHENGKTLSDTYVKYSAAQSLNDAQKAQARQNIGAGTITEIKVNGNSKGTSGSINLTNMVTFASSQTATVAGTSKTTYTYNQPTGDSNTNSSNGSAYFPEGIIMGGTAASAGLVTRGICGVSTPDATTGACTKENLYINYDDNNTYKNDRQLVLQAGSAGTHYGCNLYQYAAARGDAVKNYCDATYAKKSSLSSKADLDSNGKVLSSQLPSYVDDVEEYTSKSSFPATGTTGKIYVDTTKNLTYRWSGTTYVEISPSLALGETSSTAYAGDKGADNAKNIKTILGYFNSEGKAKAAINDGNGRDITATYVNKTVTSTESMAGSLSVAGSVTSPYIETGDTTSSYFQSRKFRGEGNAEWYYHAIDFGFTGHNQVDFYEWGGIWNFWINHNSAPTTDSNNLCLQIGDTYVKNKGNTFTWPTTSGTLALTDDLPTQATSTKLGLVKSSTTGTAANRDYNVQVNSDGTMKVNVPWTDTNTSHSHSAGVGLVGSGSAGTSGTYTYKAKLRSETALTVDSTAATTTSGRVYPVAVDKSGYLSVNVPWTDTDTNTHNSHAIISGTKSDNSTQIKGSASSGNITLGDSGASAGSYGNASNQEPGYGKTFNVPYITVNAKGIVTAISNKTVKIPASDNTNTATAADNILDGSNNGTQITYAPYTAQQSKLSFDTSTTAPTRTDRLNLNGYLYATKFNVAGKAAVQYNSTEDCIEFIFA